MTIPAEWILLPLRNRCLMLWWRGKRVVARLRRRLRLRRGVSVGVE